MEINSLLVAKGLGITQSKANLYTPFINEACSRFNIITPIEVVSFLAQVGHESALLSRFEENMNYSSDRLAIVWPNRFAVNPKAKVPKPNVLALSLHKKPQLIANNVYANRYGNGNPESGDGWNYRARGGIGITFKANYLNCGKALGIDLINHPSLLVQPRWAMLSAGWFWYANKLTRFDDDLDVTSETRIINGGTIGLQERQNLFNKLAKVLL